MLKRIFAAFAAVIITAVITIVTAVPLAAATTPIIAKPETIQIISEPESNGGFVGDEVKYNLNAESRTGSGLAYQWYYGSEKTSDGTIIQSIEINNDYGGIIKANDSSLTVKITDEMLDDKKRFFVYCLVTDIEDNVVKSQKAYITALDPENFDFDIVYKPSGEIDIYVGSEAIISAAVTLPESKLGYLSYQWYSGKTINITEAEPIENENKPYIVIPTDKVGVTYYFCKVKNEKFGRIFISDNAAYYVKTVVRYNPATLTDPLPFKDVNTGAWYYTDLLYAYRSGIINGRTGVLYRPDDGVTVAEAIKIASCVHQLINEGKVSLAHGNSNGMKWYKSYMEYALVNDIIEADLSAEANNKITREKFVDILYKMLPAEKFTQINIIRDGSIRDVEPTSKYADSIYAFYRAGIMKGNSEGNFHPEAEFLRAEAAAVITRILNQSSRDRI